MIFCEKKSLKYVHCKTHLLYSLVLFQTSGKRPGVVRIAFLITNGRSNVDPWKTIPNANLLRVSGVEIFVVAVGDYNTGVGEIEKIASPDRNYHVFRVSDMNGFVDVTKLAFKLVAPKKYAALTPHKQLC